MKSLMALVVVAVCRAAVVQAQTPQLPARPAPLVLTLEDAITRGLSASHRIAEASARQQAAGASVESRRAATLPSIAALAGYTRTNHVDEFGLLTPDNQFRVIYPDVPDNYHARLDLQWPLYTGGRLDAIANAARSEAAAAASDVDAIRSDLRLDITRAFWNLVVADESQRVFDEALTRAAVHLRDVRNQLDAGLVPPSDVLTVEAQESRQRMLTIQAHTSRDVAEADLGRLIGVPPGTPIQPNAPVEPVGMDITIDALASQAAASRADRRALLERIAAADLRQSAAAAGTRPTIGVAGGIDYARPNPRIFPRAAAWKESWDASVNVSWPLFDGGRTRAETAEAAAARRALQARLEEFDSMLALEIRQRVAEIEASRAAIAAAEDGLRAATEAHRVLGERFRAGVATSTDVLNAQVAVLQAGLDRTQALANARLADARLHRALGQ